MHLRGKIRFIAQVFLILLLAHSVLNYSLFGFSPRADRYLHDLINTYAGDWLYPAPSDQITVLLLDDTTIDHYQQGRWPASYDFHARVLKTLLRHRPAAVFIDFLWLSQRSPGQAGQPRDGDLLIHVLKRYRAAGIPVYLSFTPGVEQNLGDDLKHLVHPVSSKITIDYVDFGYRTYPPHQDGLRTSAFKMAEDADPARFTPAPQADMDIFWGTRPNPTNASWMEGDKVKPGIFDVLRSGYTGLSVPIPYTTTLYVRDLLNPRAETNDLADRQARALLENRFVLYGANLSGVNDLIFTPTRQILPGVYLHAMALDNLLHWGSDYKSANGTRWLADPRWHQAWSLLIVLPIALIFAYFDNFPSTTRRWRDPSTRRGRCLALLRRFPAALSALASLAVAAWFLLWAIFEFRYFNVSASTLAGYLEFIALGFFLERLSLLDRFTIHVIAPCQQWLRAKRTGQDS